MHLNLQEFIVIVGELIIETKRQYMLGENYAAVKCPEVDRCPISVFSGTDDVEECPANYVSK